MIKIAEILAEKITIHKNVIDEWFLQKSKEIEVNFYNSVDIRHSGFKIAPVDNNCFPAGFNNLGSGSKEVAKRAVNEFLKNNYPKAKNILIIPENHTRNLPYLNNVLSLQKIILADRNVVVGSLIADLKEVTTIDLGGNTFLDLHPISSFNGQITTINNFIPDLIISNNDFTDGVPAIIQNALQPVVPSSKLGWYQRLKSVHFDIYNELASELCDIIDLDKWLISTKHYWCNNVNFKEKIGIEGLASTVDKLLQETAQKYRQYNIDEKPFCYIKSDNGTYGMAVMTANSAEEILNINKRNRTKMSMLKSNIQNNKLIIQEGIRTVDLVNNKIAEPMIYVVNGLVVGNLFRINEKRTNANSLNGTGMTFADLSDLNESQLGIGGGKGGMAQIYSLIARISSIAASKEIQKF